MKKIKKIKKIFVFIIAAMVLLSIPVFAVGSAPLFSKTDRFAVIDSGAGTGSTFSMLSSDGQLIIHISDSTPIVFEDGTDARARLVDGQTLAELMDTRNLTVAYSVTTRSLPPQASPDSVTIIYEIPMPLTCTVK